VSFVNLSMAWPVWFSGIGLAALYTMPFGNQSVGLLGPCGSRRGA
jgi:hypothetical protein